MGVLLMGVESRHDLQHTTCKCHIPLAPGSGDAARRVLLVVMSCSSNPTRLSPTTTRFSVCVCAAVCKCTEQRMQCGLAGGGEARHVWSEV